MQPNLKDGFLIDSERLEESFTGFALHAPHTKVLALENTHLKSGGRIYPFEEILALSKVCKTLGLGLHLDGARVWHAFVESSVPLSNYGKVFDTISVCFSKGLGAPVGSCVISSLENVRRAKKIRKMLGGTMRQCGFLAAAAEYAVDNHLLRLKDDHAKAKQLAEFLQQKFPETKVNPPETNIVLMRFEREQRTKIPAVLKELELKYQMRLAMLDPLTIRAVLHLDVDSEKFAAAISS